MSSAGAFLALPREVRDQVIGQLFFPIEKEPRSFEQDRLGLAHTAPRQIFPFHPDAWRRPKFDVSILRVCRQLQLEGEAILYGSSSFNLMYDDWYSYQPKLSYHLFQRFPKRLRRLIQRVERKCYSETYRKSISLFEWDAFMRFLAEECPSLHTLHLWGPGDRRECLPWVQRCTQDQEWVQSVLQIKTLQTFDIPVIYGGTIHRDPAFRDQFLPWLRRSLTERKPSNVQVSITEIMVPFRLLDLPLELQRMIYRDVVLTDDRRIYVDMESWFNPNLRNGFSMMLTCKKLYVEIGTILFQESIWYSDTQDTFARRYDGINMLKLIERHPLPRKESRIGRVIANSKFNIKHLDFLWDNGSINKDLVAPQSHIWNMQLDSLTMRINIPTENFLREQFHRMHGGIDVRQLDPDLFADEWKTCLSDPPIPRNQWPLGLFNLKELPTYTQLLRLVVRIPYVEFRQVNGTHQAARNTDDFAKWLTRGLRQEWLRGSPSLPGIEWLFLDPTSPSTWQGTTTSISNILTSGELDL